MNKLLFTLPALVLSVAVFTPVYAALPPLQNRDVQNIQLIPSPTSILKIKTPIKEIVPISTSTPTPSNTPAPSATLTPSPSPKITAETTPPTGATGMGESEVSTPTAEPNLPAGTATPAGSSRDPMIYGFFILVAIVFLLQSQWPKIKGWLHKKTE